jgi:hypothetical protein
MTFVWISQCRATVSVAALLVIAFGSTSAIAKVSAEAMLCFHPAQTSIDEANAHVLLRLQDKARHLGRLDGIFLTTLTSVPALEAERSMQQRDARVMAWLEELGLRHTQISIDRFLAQSLEEEGCSKGQVPLQVELLFAEPPNLLAPLAK